MRDEAKSIGGSLRMREPEELVGPWIVEMGNERCTIVFEATRLDSANGWRLTDAGGCLSRIAPGAVAWRPAPEGIEFAGANRLTLATFTAVGDAVARATLPGGREARLYPAPRTP